MPKLKGDLPTDKWTQCYSCANYNYGCRFNEQPTQMINDGRGFIRAEPCDDYLPLSQNYHVDPIGLVCPKCGSHNIAGSYHDRFECKTCGKLFT